MHRDVDEARELCASFTASLMPLTKEKKQELIGKYGRADGDTGSAEVQVALLTERINHLTEHLRTHTQGPSLPPRPADDGRQAPPAAPLPRARRPGALPHRRLRPRPASLDGMCLAPSRRARRRAGSSMIAPGSPAPDFSLRNQDGERVSLSDFRGRKLLLAFYPADFSPVCTRPALDLPGGAGRDLDAQGAELVGVSVDTSWAHKAFQERLGTEIPLLSDFHPKGEVCRAYGAYIEERGHRQPLAGADRRARDRAVGPRVADARSRSRGRT